MLIGGSFTMTGGSSIGGVSAALAFVNSKSIESLACKKANVNITASRFLIAVVLR